MNKIAISGMTGFIGSNLANYYKKKGEEVVRITQNLLYSPNDLRSFFNNEQPTIIFHLASFGNHSNQKDDSMTIFANLIGTWNMLTASSDIPYKAFINFSSSSVYGKKFQAMKEIDVLTPETFYGASKAGAEHLCFAFAKQLDKPVVSVRPFSIYGEGEADFRFIPTVIRSIVENKTFLLDETGVHDWLYIFDFIEALLLVSEHPQLGVVNIGSGRSHTNKEVCEMFKKISGKQYLATPYPGMREQDSTIWLSDNKYLTGLGWYPKHMLQEGLQKTWEWYKEEYEKN